MIETVTFILYRPDGQEIRIRDAKEALDNLGAFECSYIDEKQSQQMLNVKTAVLVEFTDFATSEDIFKVHASPL